MKLTKFGILVNCFFVHFNKRYQYFQWVCENFGNSGGEWRGGILGTDFGKSRGKVKGGHTANPFCGGGMDIFWNHTLVSEDFFLLPLNTLFQLYICSIPLPPMRKKTSGTQGN